MNIPQNEIALKVLIVRFSSIGDIVLTTPVIRALKQQLGAEVHFLTKHSFQSVLAANPYIDQLWSIKKEVDEVIPQLRSIGFDYLIDLHNNLRSLRLKRVLRVKSYTFDKINWQKWLIVNFKINRLPNIHIVDRYLAAAKPLGIQNDGKGLDYFIAMEDEVNIPSLLGAHGHVNQVYIAFVIGAAHATKRLPKEKIIEICAGIKGVVILLGGPDEKEVGAEIAVAAGRHVINVCGQMRLNQSVSLVQQAKQVIAHDTGLMHVAAAFKKDVISIWGNTIPDFGMYPYLPVGEGRSEIIEVEHLSCRPCSKIGYQKCPKGHFKCMQEIPAEKLLSKLK